MFLMLFLLRKLCFFLKKVGVDNSVFEKMTKEADSNRDGEIEFDEFKNIMEKFFKEFFFFLVFFKGLLILGVFVKLIFFLILK